MPLTRGSLYRYNYLWSREHEKKEMSGRKARPVCLVVRSNTAPASLFLFPLTSQAPKDSTLSLEIPDAQCRLAGLMPPCWIILDEYNRCSEDALHDFESLVPLGHFSLAFLKRIALVIARAAEASRLKAVNRT